VRPLREADLGPLARCSAAAFVETYGATHDAARVARYVGRHFTETAWHGVLARGELVWGAWQRHELAGFLQARAAPLPMTSSASAEAPCEVARLYVRRAAHGQGLGRALLDAAARHAEGAGHDLLWLGVWAGNAAAQAFYAHVGFAAAGWTRFDFEGVDEDDLVLVRPLVP
jgi:ribosomal protein S18 acetylase RimI-like enzyme